MRPWVRRRGTHRAGTSPTRANAGHVHERGKAVRPPQEGDAADSGHADSNADTLPPATHQLSAEDATTREQRAPPPLPLVLSGHAASLTPY